MLQWLFSFRYMLLLIFRFAYSCFACEDGWGRVVLLMEIGFVLFCIFFCLRVLFLWVGKDVRREASFFLFGCGI